MKKWLWFLVVGLHSWCWSRHYKIGAPILTSVRHVSLASLSEGYDERFDKNASSSHESVEHIRRYLDIQQKVRALENPNVSLNTRSDQAREWLELDRIRKPNITLRLWEAWLLTDDSLPKSRDDDVSISPTTSF